MNRRMSPLHRSTPYHLLALLLFVTASWVVAMPLAAQTGPGVDPVPPQPSHIAQPQPPAAPGAAGMEPQTPIPTRNLLDVIRDGGPLMIPIGLCSFILFVFLFERSISLRKGRVIPGPFVRRFLDQLRERQLTREEAIGLCEQNKSPVAEVFASAMRKWGRPSVEVEQAILDAGERVTNQLRRYLRLFNGVATISPLLGLLGTVTGMIGAFNTIATADALGRPELLATGISQALLTTAAGLTVAIPALIFYLFFISRVDRLVMEIDVLGQEIVALISAEARADAKNSKKAA